MSLRAYLLGLGRYIHKNIPDEFVHNVLMLFYLESTGYPHHGNIMNITPI